MKSLTCENTFMKGCVYMKKILAIISAITLCASAVSCAKKNEKQDKELSFNAEKMSDTAYKKELIKIPDGTKMIFRVDAFDKCSKYFITGASSDGVAFWIANADLSSFEKVDIPDFRYGASYMPDVSDDGVLTVFLNDITHGDLPAPDENSDDRYIEEYEAAAEYTFRIMTFSTDGKLISDSEVNGFSTLPEQMTQITDCVSDGKTVIANIDGSYEVFSVDGTYIGALTANDGETIENIGKNNSGKLMAAIRTDADSVQLREITDKGETKKSSVTYGLSETVYGEIEPGWGDYTMFIRSMTTIYGIRSGDDSIVPLFNVNRAGLNSSNFSNFVMCPDGYFAVPITNYSNWTCKINRFIPCAPSELENIPTLTIGFYGRNWPLEEYIEIFNDENQDYQITLKSYGGDSEEYEDATEQIKQDALGGNLPDIIVSSEINGMIGDFNTLNMDIYCDLYEFMDNDENLNRDALVPSLLEHLDYNFNGHLYLMPESFRVRLPYIAKTELVEDIENWNFNTYLDLLEDPPAGMADEFKNKEETQWQRLRIDSFSDYLDFKNVSCNFDSPDFIRALKYAYEGIPDNQYTYASEGEEYDQDAEERKYAYAIRENRELFTNGSIFCYKDYINLTKGEFGGEPFTVLGKPGSENGGPVIETESNSYGITKASENKELAWEFIKHMLSDDYYKNHYLTENYGWGKYFVPTKSGMKILEEYERQPEDHKHEPTLKDYGGCVYNTWIKDRDGNYIYERLGYVDDSVVAEVNELIDSAKPSDQSYIYAAFTNEQTSETMRIFNDEIEKFFHGESSAEDCAAMIQSRISIYLSEQFG